MLEHLDSAEAALFFGEVHRVLKPGGIIRLAVPDLKRGMEKYMRDGDADEFVKSLYMGGCNLRRLSGKIRMLILGNRDHRWMYDGASLVRLLQASGFANATQLQPGETMIVSPEPLDLREREEESIYVEALQP
jgi:predicted SAM-dependent methyltransferase